MDSTNDTVAADRSSRTTAGAGSSPVSSPPSSPPDHAILHRQTSLARSHPAAAGDDAARRPGVSQYTAALADGPSSAAKQPETKTPKPRPRKTAAAAAAADVDASNGLSSSNLANVAPSKDQQKPKRPYRKRQKINDESKSDTNGSLKHQPAQFTGSAASLSSQPTDKGPQSAVYGPTQQQISPKSGSALMPNSSHLNHSLRPPPRPSSSGQHYDPIRSAINSNAPKDVKTSSAASNLGSVSSGAASRPSPSITSLVSRSPDEQPPKYPDARPRSHLRTSEIVTNGSASGNHHLPTSGIRSPGNVPPPTPMEVDSVQEKPKPNRQVSAEPRKTSNSPKPITKQKTNAAAAAAPVPVGSGLLSSAAFGGDNSNTPREYAEVPNQCIVIQVPLKSKSGNYINFMKEVEQKYGFDVAHPRVAEHRRHLKEVAAASAAIESVPASADEMILDASDADSNPEGGAGGGDSGTAAENGKKRRGRVNEYNKDDDFIDDSELLWEEQALASKDGYFVWSGPLLQEGEKPTVEKSDGTLKRGRGGRGRGGATRGEVVGRARGGGESGAGVTNGTAGRGRGNRSSRGGAAVRKPRVTKGDRAQMESEKQERERMAAIASKPTFYPGTVS